MTDPGTRHAPPGEPRGVGAHVGVRRLRAAGELTALAEVRAAAKDWQRLSSRLQGDPDVRDYPQLPLEVDPPEHGTYRALLDPILGRRAIAALEPAVRRIARDLVGDFARRGRTEAVHELAVPMVASTIAHAFGRPDDAAELASWGITSWEVGPDGTRSGARLGAYVDRVLEEGARGLGEVARRVDAPAAGTGAPGATGSEAASAVSAAIPRDAFALLAGARIEGRPLTRLEQVGFANLLLAGGRDTVILLLCGAIWHLATDAEARHRLRTDPARLPLAIEEYLRYLSPNPGMERRVTADVQGDWGIAKAGELVVLGWGPANHDPIAFDAPGEIRLDRRPNPHVAFGSGPHTCIGIHLARLEARVVLEELLAAVPAWRLAGRVALETIRLAGDVVPARFDALPLAVGER